MWESILKKEQWEIEVNPDHKSIRFHISKNHGQENEEGQISLQLDQADLFELMHSLLSINRSFNNETMYYDDQEIMDPA
ncbi:hypothetical protein [Paenibacillus radicis (ex Xue et al. 2023)]|uniref:Uncharacterized protein n=1 Tax=Paenibacillus radicis (ex Xue et al. 2023) TaxID=2972489 RepID=A0ABT1YQI7_9BACL|nr:hypothetical protein [Paenibacillus radicis (ex Xue et al. 2023)]MCR8634543.1 hypothetical protein [Paenibacillus radicis (ex Xue et al. 2023)]